MLGSLGKGTKIKKIIIQCHVTMARRGATQRRIVRLTWDVLRARARTSTCGEAHTANNIKCAKYKTKIERITQCHRLLTTSPIVRYVDAPLPSYNLLKATSLPTTDATNFTGHDIRTIHATHMTRTMVWAAYTTTTTNIYTYDAATSHTPHSHDTTGRTGEIS